MASLENELPGYQKRPEQIEFMTTVASALGQPGLTVIEAGTGIGKSLGYLIPLLCDARHFTIATGTRVLQTQLLDQSLPVARAATGDRAPIQLRMGRDNYVCPRNLSDALERPGRQEKSAVLQVLSDIDEWYRQHRHGMLWQMPEQIALESVRDRVTCSSQDCGGRQCPFFDTCPYFVSRMNRERGCVVNHHLLIAETLGQSETVSRRDEPETLLIDEAHLLVERLEGFASQSLTSERFRALVYRMDRAVGEPDRDQFQYRELRQMAERVLRLVVTCEQSTSAYEAGREWSEDQLVLQFEEIEFVLEQMLEELRALIDSGQWVADIIVNVQALIDHVLIVQDRLANPKTWHSFEDLTTLKASEPEIIALFREVCLPFEQVILVSGSVALSGNFDYVSRKLGITQADCKVIDTPYRFDKQTRSWCIPLEPNVADEEHTETFIEAIMPVVSQVKALLLFTTKEALFKAHRACREKMQSPCFLYQGGDATSLLQAVTEVDHAIVLASKSFWQGADFRQTGIQCVAMDRLPFAPPERVGIDHRSHALDEYWAERSDEFHDELLPRCGLELKQGFGRLIRHEMDRGVFILGDGRFMSKDYGRALRGWMPNTEWVKTAAELIDFLRHTPESQA